MRMTQFVYPGLSSEWYAACDAIAGHVLKVRPECASFGVSLCADREAVLCRIELVTANGVSARFEIAATSGRELAVRVRSRLARFVLVSLPQQAGTLSWAA